MSFLSNSKFVPGRGGHAPGDLRDAFADAVDDYVNSNQPAEKVEVRGPTTALRELCGLLWNCRDIMPKMLCDDISNLTHWTDRWSTGHTYAQGARMVRRHIEKQCRMEVAGQ